ncbi:MAG: hypothetical protein ABIP46_01230 [Polaromonas sp.]
MVTEPTTDPNPELSADKIHEDKELWCQTYEHVWADLSKGVYDKDAVQKAADEHWQRSPKSPAVEVATMEFLKSG